MSSFTTDLSGATNVSGGIPRRPYTPNIPTNILNTFPSLAPVQSAPSIPSVAPFAGHNIIEGGAHDNANATTGVTVKAAMWSQGWNREMLTDDLIFAFIDHTHHDHTIVLGNVQIVNALLDEGSTLQTTKLRQQTLSAAGVQTQDISDTEDRYMKIKDMIPVHDMKGSSLALQARNKWSFIGVKGHSTNKSIPETYFKVCTGPAVRMPAMASARSKNGDRIYACFKEREMKTPSVVGPNGNSMYIANCEEERSPVQIEIIAKSHGVPLALTKIGDPAPTDTSYMAYCVPVRPRNKVWRTDAQGRKYLAESSVFSNQQLSGIIYINDLIHEAGLVCLGKVWEFNQKLGSSKTVEDAQRNVMRRTELGNIRIATN